MLFTLLVAGLLVFAPCLAGAIAPETHTVHWGGFPDPMSNIAAEITQTYNIIFWIIALIALGVYAALLYVIWRFRRQRQPRPATWSHNVPREIVWTVIPALICAYIGYESYRILSYMHKTPAEGLNVEVIGYQFGWEFHYPELGFEAPLPLQPHPTLSIPDKERYVPEMVVPVNTNIRLQVTAKDVIHSYFVPAVGVKMDAIPGRINYKWFRPTQVGEYIGQCAELCGAAHGEMFLTLKVVDLPTWNAWVNTQRVAKGLAPLPVTPEQALVTVPTEPAPVAPTPVALAPVAPAAVAAAAAPVTATP